MASMRYSVIISTKITNPIHDNTNIYPATPCQGICNISYYTQDENRFFLYTQPKYCGIDS